MAVTPLGNQTYIVLTTDTKPTNVPAGARCFELDRNMTEWYYDGLAWKQKFTIDNDIFFDDFNDGNFNFTEGGTSPNGKWKNKFRSGGTTGVRTNGGRNVQYLIPGVATNSGQTFSVVNYILNDLFQDFEMTFQMRTIAHTRTGSAANAWETAWIIYRIGDIAGQMGYYFYIGTDHSEFGKSDNIDASVSNYVLATPSSPVITLGQWDNIKIRVVANHHKIWVNNTLVIDYEDISPRDAPLPSRQILGTGYIATYCEDAEVEFDNFRIQTVYPKSLLDYEESAHNTTPLPSSNRKSGAYYATTATTGDGVLTGILTNPSTSNASNVDDLGVNWTFTSSTLTSGQCGLKTSSAIFRRSHNLILRTKIKNPSTLTGTAIWVGFASVATLPNTDNPLNNAHGVLVGYRSGSGVWGVLSCNGTATNSVTTEGMSSLVNEWTNIYMDLQANGKCVIRLNNRPPLTITSPTLRPSASTNMYLHVICENMTAAARTMSINYIDVESSPGNDVIV